MSECIDADKDQADKKIFFIHVPKTAGTYLDEVLRSTDGLRYYHGSHCVCDGKPVQYFSRGFNVKAEDSEGFTDSVRIAVVRNPFDLLVSMYTYGFPYWPPGISMTTCRARGGCNLYWPFSSFKDFCEKFCDDAFPWLIEAQRRSLYFQLFDAQGKLVPHYLLRQETLTQSLNALLQKLGLPAATRPGERVRSSRDAQFRDYKKFYTKDLARLVAEKCRNDLALFGYSFSGHDGRTLLDASDLPGLGAGELPASAFLPDGRSVYDGSAAEINMHANQLLGFTSVTLAKELVRRLVGTAWSVLSRSGRG